MHPLKYPNIGLPTLLCHFTMSYTNNHFTHISFFMTKQLHWLPFTTRTQFKVLFLVPKSRLSSAPKYLCDHTRPPISASSLPVSALPNAMIFSCLMLGQPWATLSPLLLLVRHSGSTFLLFIFARLFSLFSFPRLSLSP